MLCLNLVVFLVDIICLFDAAGDDDGGEEDGDDDEVDDEDDGDDDDDDKVDERPLVRLPFRCLACCLCVQLTQAGNCFDDDDDDYDYDDI